MLAAVDAATSPASVAVLAGERTLAEEVAPSRARVDAWVLPALQRCLAEAGIRPSEVEGYAATVGPGSFTGIRVGLATCRGLAAPGGLPVAGVQTLEALAETGAVHGDLVAPCIDARRGQVYVALYRLPEPTPLPLQPSWGPLACSPREASERLARSPGAVIIGSGVRHLPGGLPGTVEGPTPLAAAAARLAARTWRATGPGSFPPPEPFYLRGPDVRPAASPLLGSLPEASD